MRTTITLDLEDSTGRHEPAGRWVLATEHFFDRLAEHGVRATVFVVGDAARAQPALVKRAVGSGHEIALHGLHHVPLGESGPDRLARELREGRELLEHISGQPVAGFRAPIFSLTPATSWAVDAFAEAGLSYSSSILPALNPLHGWPGLPETPFAWDNGVVELPCPVLGIGKARIPFLGGIYLRYVPARLAARRLAQLRAEGVVPWSYVHPYDLDPGAPIERFPHANWPTSLLLHTRRRATWRRLLGLLGDDGAGRPLGEIVTELRRTGLPQVAR